MLVKAQGTTFELVPTSAPEAFQQPLTTNTHWWWQIANQPIGGGESCAEYACTSCGAWREEISGNGVDTVWGDGDTDLHQSNGADPDGECPACLQIAGVDDLTQTGAENWFREEFGCVPIIRSWEEHGYASSVVEIEAVSVQGSAVMLGGKWFDLKPHEEEFEEVDPLPTERTMRGRTGRDRKAVV